ncbi:DUF6193 family natural product biosynthesis protein [Kitasatospora aburaviensis]
MILEGDPAARRGQPAVLEAAYAEPRLRALFPFPSHGALNFHRNTQFPWSNDLPFIVGDAQSCIVYAPLGTPQRVLGQSLTPQEAAALVVAHLPLRAGLRRTVAPAGQPHRLSIAGRARYPRAGADGVGHPRQSTTSAPPVNRRAASGAG